MVAKTFVVRRAAMGSPIVVPGLTAPPAPAGYAGAWGTPPPDPTGATTGWGPAVDPSSAGWASPTPPPAAAPTAPDPGVPQWDEARGTYIQWDPAQGAWMQWNEGTKTWSRIARSVRLLEPPWFEDGDRAETALEVVLEGPRGEVLDLRGGLRRDLVEGLTEPTPEDVVEQHERVG